MAQRDKTSAKRATTKTARKSASAPETTVAERADALEQVCRELRAELESARQRIAALEQSRRQVADRLDWVIDSLSGLSGRGD